MDPILKKGLESILKIEIIESLKDDSNINDINRINYVDYLKLIHGVKSELDSKENDSYGSNNLTIIIRNLLGKVYEIRINPSINILSLKKYINKNHEDNKIDPNKMVLVYGSKILDDYKSISDYSIRNESTICLYISQNKAILSDIFHFQYNYDFRNIKDQPNTHFRGDYVYNRPCGTMRYAISVLNRFGHDSPNWLKADKEGWPVSYHSSLSYIDIKNTILSNVSSIILKPNEEVLTTPSFIAAKRNANTFIYHNEKYFILFQNRINPNSISKLMINGNEYWKSLSSEKHIRPYSIVIGKV